MSDQPLDLRRSMQLVRRHKIVVAAFAVLGLAAGFGLASLSRPTLTSNALVVLPPTARNIATQTVIASSDAVLSAALHRVDPGESPQSLRAAVRVKAPTPYILSISAQGKTAAQAERITNAVANSYVAFVKSADSPGSSIDASILQPAVSATGSSSITPWVIYGLLGVLVGLLLGSGVVLAARRRDRRLRNRDDIADCIGVPVLASARVGRPSGAAGWAKLFEDYRPGAADAWSLRKALRQLWLTSVDPSDRGAPSGSSLSVLSLSVLSLSSDPKALSLGPQLAVFAASLGIPTVLIVGPQQDTNVTAALRAACTTRSEPLKRSRYLSVTVSDQGESLDQLQLPGAGLTIVVAVVDGETPRVADTMHAATTVLAVSASAVTAEQLARVAASAAADSRDIAGILVADPDPADHTTGRMPELSRPAQPRMPTRVTGISTEIRR
jgi:capsular polysaccharide biosynthesis protein